MLIRCGASWLDHAAIRGVVVDRGDLPPPSLVHGHGDPYGPPEDHVEWQYGLPAVACRTPAVTVYSRDAPPLVVPCPIREEAESLAARIADDVNAARAAEGAGPAGELASFAGAAAGSEAARWHLCGLAVGLAARLMARGEG